MCDSIPRDVPVLRVLLTETENVCVCVCSGESEGERVLAGFAASDNHDLPPVLL